jgi:hypothetical protein
MKVFQSTSICLGVGAGVSDIQTVRHSGHPLCLDPYLAHSHMMSCLVLINLITTLTISLLLFFSQSLTPFSCRDQEIGGDPDGVQ